MKDNASTPQGDTPATPPIHSEDMAPGAFLVTIKEHSTTGHDIIVEPIANAIEIIKNALVKKGKWLYVANRRFKMDPANPADTQRLETALRETPSARLTGSLRGGQDGVEGAAVEAAPAAGKAKKAKKPKKAKAPKVPKAARPPRVRKSKKSASAAPASILPLPETAQVQIVLKDHPFKGVGKDEVIIGVFTVDKAKGQVSLYPSAGPTGEDLLSRYQNPVGTLFLKQTKQG